NLLPSGYEPPALTDELQPLVRTNYKSTVFTNVKDLLLFIVSSSSTEQTVLYGKTSDGSVDAIAMSDNYHSITDTNWQGMPKKGIV
ncbi:MAG: hypothetical protein ABIR46_00095, partial [Candidatus Saccharimonadales bacterium]